MATIGAQVLGKLADEDRRILAPVTFCLLGRGCRQDDLLGGFDRFAVKNF